MSVDLEKRGKRIENLVKVGGLLLGGFIVAPVVFVAIKGLIGFAIAASLGWGIIYFTPVAAMKMRNWRLKAIKFEAQRNPVETLQNEFLKEQQRVDNVSEGIVKLRTAIMECDEKLENLREKFPGSTVLKKLETGTVKLRQLLTVREGALVKLNAGLVEFERNIEMAELEWEAGVAAAQANGVAGMTEEDFLSQVSIKEAFGATRRMLNEQFAAIDQTVLEEGSARQIVEETRMQKLEVT